MGARHVSCPTQPCKTLLTTLALLRPGLLSPRVGLFGSPLDPHILGTHPAIQSWAVSPMFPLGFCLFPIPQAPADLFLISFLLLMYSVGLGAIRRS